MPELGSFFESFLKREPLFQNRLLLQQSYIPSRVVHRDEQIHSLAGILAPGLKQEKPSNVFIYGKTGTGKTVTVQHTVSELMKVAKKNNVQLRFLYINCKLKKIADTEYRLIAHMARELGKDIPPTGLPTDEVYKIFYSAVDKEKGTVLLVLDEIDYLVKKAGDSVLYNLTRINTELKNSVVTLIGISNSSNFTHNLDPRVKSSLSEEEIVFPPYNALQIKDILLGRVKDAFKEGVVEEGVIEKCSAYAAREHGDARRALELLRVAAELAERKNESMLTMKYLDEAEQKIEKDSLHETVSTQPKQFQLVLYAILLQYEQKKDQLIFTGEVYDLYKKLCVQVGVRALTQRRVSDIIAEQDMLGIINIRLISKGRYGRTREITLDMAPSTFITLKKQLSDSLQFEQ